MTSKLYFDDGMTAPLPRRRSSSMVRGLVFGATVAASASGLIWTLLDGQPGDSASETRQAAAPTAPTHVQSAAAKPVSLARPMDQSMSDLVFGPPTQLSAFAPSVAPAPAKVAAISPAAPAVPPSVAVVDVPTPPAREVIVAAVEPPPMPPANPFKAEKLAKAEPEPAPAVAPAPKPSKQAARPTRPSAAQTTLAKTETASDKPNFFERIFGAPATPPGPAMAYARPDDGALGVARSYESPAPKPSVGARTAVYDIEAHVVYMPDGKRLEAHSGLGGMIDDARYIHAKNRGPTPPNTYDLTLREQLFHGVRAIRLNPVNGGAMFGRDGILAHSYMLGPNGDSNGCVSFRDYQQFLQAFLRGEVNRLVVVPRQGATVASRI